MIASLFLDCSAAVLSPVRLSREWRIIERANACQIARALDVVPLSFALLFDHTHVDLSPGATQRALDVSAAPRCTAVRLARDWLDRLQPRVSAASEAFDHYLDHIHASRRERDIFFCLASGMPLKQVASALRLSESTTRNHVVSLHRRASVSSTVALFGAVAVFVADRAYHRSDPRTNSHFCRSVESTTTQCPVSRRPQETLRCEEARRGQKPGDHRQI